jgi:hypothetical protein
MKKIYKNKWAGIGILIALILAAAAIIMPGCKKSPTDNIKIIINPDIIKNSMVVEITDAADSATHPANVTVGFSGQDANYIYETGGTKTFNVKNGVLAIGLGPQRVLTAGSPARFNITVSAPGYLPFTQALSISSTQQSQVIKLKLINLSKPPAGLQIYQTDVPLLNGAVAAQTSFKVFSSAQPQINARRSQSTTAPFSDDGQTSVILPEGTTFHYYTSEQTGTATSITISPQYEQDPISLNNGNGTAYYNRLVKYDTLQVNYPVYSLIEHEVSASDVTIVAYYSQGYDVPYSVYPYNDYTPFNVKLINGTSIPEDQLLYKSAVTKKLSGIEFTAIQNGIKVEVSPDKQYNWYTSFVLNPAAINPQTGNPIQPGDSIEAGLDVTNHVTLHTVVQKVTLSDGSTQLRAQSQTPDVGYYYKATYSTDYNYTFNSAAPSVSDGNNISAYGYVSVTTGGSYIQAANFYVQPNSGILNCSGKVRSFTPIQIQAGMEIEYWGKYYFSSTVSGVSGSVGLPFFTLQPTVTFNVTFSCTTNSKQFNGAGYASITGDDGSSGYAFMSDGIWSTNGMKQGHKYIASIISSTGLTGGWTNTLNTNNFVQNVVNPGNYCTSFH